MTLRIRIGDIDIGGGAPVSIQSMTNTDTSDAEATLIQIRCLAEAGCDIVRLAVPDMSSVTALPEIIAGSRVPLVADIHFDYRLALAAIDAGIDGVRINPGNIGSPERVRAVVEAAGEAGIPIRVGANSGSLPKGLLKAKLDSGMQKTEALAESLVEAAMEQVKLLESFGFTQIKVSLKASSVPVTVKAYRRFATLSDYPLHIGVTEAGTMFHGLIKSSVGIGALLLDGIGDTLRVSLTADPVEEVRAGIAILEAVGLREARPEIVSCPTCGRTSYDMFSLVGKVEDFIAGLKSSGTLIKLNKIAVMGCVVNGPGEAADAELGIAGGGKGGNLVLFRYGQTIATLPESEAFERLRKEILNYEC